MDLNTSATEVSNTIMPIQLELYTVTVGIIIMLIFGTSGLLTNTALLVAIRCMSPSSTRNCYGINPGCYFAIPCALASVNIFFSVIWVPLDAMHLLLNYNQVGLNPVACYVDQAVLVFCLAAIILLNVSMALHRCIKYNAWNVSHGTFICCSLLISLLLALVCAACALPTFHKTLDYQLCVQSSMIGSKTALVLLPLLGVIVFLLIVLLITIYLLIIILWRLRCKLNNYRIMRCHRNRKGSDSGKVSESKDGAQERFLEPSSDNQESRSSRKSSKALSGSSSKQMLCTKENSIDKQFGVPDKKSGDDSDDDDFDQKMKQRLQKSMSGRRHTVANISLGLTSSLNKTSSQDSVNRSPSPFNYQYVRKWSVDIQALQDQLENPKGLLGANPFGLSGSFKRDKHIPSNHSIEEKPEHEETEQSSLKDEHKEGTSKLEGKPKAKVDRTNSDQTGTKSKDMGVKFGLGDLKTDESKTEKTMASSGSEVRFQDTIEEHDEEKSEEEVDAKAHESIIEEDEKDSEVDGIIKFPEPEPNKKIVSNGNHMESAQLDMCNQSDGLIEQDPELQAIERIRETTSEMQTNTIVLVLLVTVFLCTSPFLIMNLLQWTIDYSLNRNLCWILAGVSLLQMPLHVMIITWMERPLYKAMRRLWIKLTHWQCVCYCNIGKGKKCFQRPGYREASPAV